MRDTTEQQQAVLDQVTVKAKELTQDLIRAQLESEETWTLKAKESAVLAGITVFGKELLSGLLRLHETPYVPDTVPCPCGRQAEYQRRREGGVQTIVGEVRVKRSYYLCPDCHQGCYPLDEELEFCAGGLSAGLEECAALAGVVEPFASAAELLRRLLWTGVELSHNRVRGATEDMGHTLAQAEDELVQRVFASETSGLPERPKEGPKRLYVSADGTCVRCKATEEEGEAGTEPAADQESLGHVWREAKVAALYETEEVTTARKPDETVLKAKEIEYYADISDAQHFARLVWLKAYERGVSHAEEVVLLGDGAQWIWLRLGMLFPEAIQILDWYHAKDYLIQVAQAVFGPGTQPGIAWLKRALDLLWDGKVQQVIQDLETLQQAHPQIEAIQDTITYYTNNQCRMNYPAYRERGLQIGSGTIESGCKRVAKARLDQAGMTWTVEGARAVLKARAAYLSRQWDDFWQDRPFQPRAYRRRSAQATRLAA
ncbi:ISKra4 family transposase [Chloroflexota bacterium]